MASVLNVILPVFALSWSGQPREAEHTCVATPYDLAARQVLCTLLIWMQGECRNRVNETSNRGDALED